MDGVQYDRIEKRIKASVKIPTVHSSYARAIESSLSIFYRRLWR